MNKCLEKQKLPKLTPGETGNLNGLFKKIFLCQNPQAQMVSLVNI